MAARKFKIRFWSQKLLLIGGGVAAGVVGKSVHERLSQSHGEDFEYEKLQGTSIKLQEFSRKYGFPSTTTILPYKGHVVSYDHYRRVPAWVIEHLSREQLKGDAAREHSHFKSDRRIPRLHSASSDDYLKSGFSRGHLSPAADHGYDQDAMNDTFFLSNIIPQNPENNAGYWYRMEYYCRELTKKFSDVYIISGPLFLPKKGNKEGKKQVVYEIIGKNNVAVPTHLFKVILVENHGVPQGIGCFVVPNEAIPPEKPLRAYQVNLDQFQADSGLSLFTSAMLGEVPGLCTIDGCQLLRQDVVDFKNFSRQIRKAQNVEELEKIWMKIRTQSKNLKGNIADVYRRKKEELSRGSSI